MVQLGDCKYEFIEEWAKLPEFFDLNDPVDITIAPNDRVYVGSRDHYPDGRPYSGSHASHPILVFEPNGEFVSCWGEREFVDPHGLCIGPDNSVYVADAKTNVVTKATLGGKCLSTLGTRFLAIPIMLRQPFNQPTDVAIGLGGELFVTDGYGNYLVHKFSPEGELLKTWGEPGAEPGQFALPHKLGIDRHGIVYVCDRNNDRIQRFTPDGELVDVWTGFTWPQDIFIDNRNDSVYIMESKPNPPHARLSVRSLEGKELSSWDGTIGGDRVLDISHSICLDSSGNIYIGEIVRSPGIRKLVRVQ